MNQNRRPDQYKKTTPLKCYWREENADRGDEGGGQFHPFLGEVGVQSKLNTDYRLKRRKTKGRLVPS